MEKAKLKPGWLKKQVDESVKNLKEKNKCPHCKEMFETLSSINKEIGPQKGPSSVSKINAETKHIINELKNGK